MKEWWNNLSLREKQTLSLGGFFVVLFLIYALLWSPLNSKVNSLREQIVKDQKLLAWMQETNQHILTLEKSFKTGKQDSSGVSLLSIMQKQINKTQFVSSLGQLRQADNDSVQLNFTNVDFDKLVTWLTELSQEEGVVIAQMSVAAGATPGVVSVDLVLKR
jgi:type II secretory pathway component PulM